MKGPDLSVNTHGELKKAVKCATDLFEVNVSTLTEISRLKKQKEKDKELRERENEVITD